MKTSSQNALLYLLTIAIMVSLILVYKYTFIADEFRINYTCRPISEPKFVARTGCYILTEDVIVEKANMEGIHIRARIVKIDLNGFSVKGPGRDSNQAGIYIEGGETVEIKNGSVEGFLIGIRGEDDRDGSVTQSIVIEDVTIKNAASIGLKLDAEEILVDGAKLLLNEQLEESKQTSALVASAEECRITSSVLPRVSNVKSLEVYKALAPNCKFDNTRIMQASEAN